MLRSKSVKRKAIVGDMPRRESLIFHLLRNISAKRWNAKAREEYQANCKTKPVVMFLRGRCSPFYIQHQYTEDARLQANSLSDLHLISYEETDEGFIVDASRWYDEA